MFYLGYVISKQQRKHIFRQIWRNNNISFMAFEKKIGENSKKIGENSKQVNLDVGSITNFVPKTISNILTELSLIPDFSKKSSKLDFHLHSLGEEMGKIDAFKRELPYCMQLLKDAIEILKKEKFQWKGREMSPVTEEFIPLNRDFEGEGRAKRSNDISEKKNWMSSVQLWSTPIQYENKFETRNQDSVLSLKSRYEQEDDHGKGFEIREEYHGCNLKNGRGAFSPFKKAKSDGTTTNDEEDKRDGPPIDDGLSLSIPVAEVESIDLRMKDDCGFNRPKLQHQQLQRKQRRCWSPELHKRFVEALQHLGGPQTATPKQIRELMKVDGLTNDEVKSHLQKYRLHIRKLPSSSSTDYSWLTQDHHRHDQFGGLMSSSSKQIMVATSNSGSPQDHLYKAGKGSINIDHSMEEDNINGDDKSETHSSNWKLARLQNPVELKQI